MQIQMLILFILRNELLPHSHSNCWCEWQTHWQPIVSWTGCSSTFQLAFKCLSERFVCVCVHVIRETCEMVPLLICHCILIMVWNKSENMHVRSMFTWKTCGITISIRRHGARSLKIFLKCITFCMADHFLDRFFFSLFQCFCFFLSYEFRTEESIKSTVDV